MSRRKKGKRAWLRDFFLPLLSSFLPSFSFGDFIINIAAYTPARPCISLSFFLSLPSISPRRRLRRERRGEELPLLLFLRPPTHPPEWARAVVRPGDRQWRRRRRRKERKEGRERSATYTVCIWEACPTHYIPHMCEEGCSSGPSELFIYNNNGKGSECTVRPET